MKNKLQSANTDYGLRGQSASDARAGLKVKRVDAIALMLLLIGFSAAVTQEFASLLAYHDSLGQPLVGRFYAPWMGLSWAHQYSLFEHPQALVAMRRVGAVCILILGVYLVFVITMRRPRASNQSAAYGSARFATMDDINRMGLRDNDGVVLGAYQENGKRVILRHDGPEHVLMVAPTGSGKGVSVVNPTLLTWPHSCVVYDLKKENWALSSKWRQDHAGNTVLRFEPACADGSGACYNPLGEVRLDTDHDVQDVQNIAAIITDYGAESTDKSSDYFESAGYALLVALTLHTCYVAHRKGKSASLTDVADLMNDPAAEYADLLGKIGTTVHKNNRPHPICESESMSMINMLKSGAGRQFAGIWDTVRSKLALYRDPIIRKNIARSDFRIVDLMNHEKPTTLYICVGSTDKTRLKPITKLLFSQIIRTLTREVTYDHGISKPSYKHKLLLLIDEFPSLGRMAIMNEAIAFLRGYGIKCLLIIQDFSQLRDNAAYGDKESITANCGVRIAFAPNTIATAKELSEMVGTTTITNSDSAHSASARIFSESGGNVTVREMSRSLLTPDEVMRLRTIRTDSTGDHSKIEPGDSLVFLVGEPVIYGHQILHFEDQILAARAALGALDQSNRLSDTF